MDERLRDGRGEAGGGGTHPDRVSGGARDVGNQDRRSFTDGGRKRKRDVGRVEGGGIKTGRRGRQEKTDVRILLTHAWTANDRLVHVAQPLVKREASVSRCCVCVLCRCVCRVFFS